ncbi:MAG: flagellar basal body-associated FliL family protein [Deltaproteobacteria bacterium]|nr:flagellar basal body-associated FliL family protein [Deltaproteobacteria bacterium]
MADAESKKGKEGEEHAPPPKKKSKLLLIGIAAVVVLGLGAGGFFFMKSKSSPDKAHGAEEVAAAEGEGKSTEGGHGGEAKAGEAQSTIFNLDPFIVNLQDNSGTRYLKLTVNLDLTSPTAQAEITAQTTQIRDSLIILLSSKSYTDIGTVEGKYQMRDEIVARVNQFLTKSKVKTAYFTEFVIQ